MRYDPEITLYHTPNGVYDPVDGRWMQLYPIGIEDGLNRYADVRSSPLMGVDPTGLCTGSRIVSDDGTCQSADDFSTETQGLVQGLMRARGAHFTGLAIVAPDDVEVGGGENLADSMDMFRQTQQSDDPLSVALGITALSIIGRAQDLNDQGDPLGEALRAAFLSVANGRLCGDDPLRGSSHEAAVEIEKQIMEHLKRSHLIQNERRFLAKQLRATSHYQK